MERLFDINNIDDELSTDDEISNVRSVGHLKQLLRNYRVIVNGQEKMLEANLKLTGKIPMLD